MFGPIHKRVTKGSQLEGEYDQIGWELNQNRKKHAFLLMSVHPIIIGVFLLVSLLFVNGMQWIFAFFNIWGVGEPHPGVAAFGVSAGNELLSYSHTLARECLELLWHSWYTVPSQKCLSQESSKCSRNGFCYYF